MTYNENDSTNAYCGKQYNGEFVAITMYEFLLTLCNVSNHSKNGVPYHGAERGVAHEGEDAHLGKARRDGNQLPDHGHQSADERRDGAVLHEVCLCTLHLFLGEEQRMAPLCFHEAVDDQSSEPDGEQIVDDGAKQRAERGGKNDAPHCHVAFRFACYVGCRRHHDFRRERNERALHSHQRGNEAVAHVLGVGAVYFRNDGVVQRVDLFRWGGLVGHQWQQ